MKVDVVPTQSIKFAFFNGYIVTARDDGAIPLNSRIVAGPIPFGEDSSRGLLTKLIQQANKYHDIEKGKANE